MEKYFLLFFIATIGLSLSLFFSFILLWVRPIKSYSNLLLGWLLFFLSIRIGKSVFYNFIELPLFVKNLGLAANLAVGPLLYLYGKSFYQTQFKTIKTHFYHFLPAILYVVFSPIIPNSNGEWLWYLSYTFILAQSFFYVLLSLFTLHKKLPRSEPKTQWYAYLIFGLTGMWIVYSLIFIKLIPIYFAGPLSFTLLICLWIYLGIKEKNLAISFSLIKYEASKLTERKRTQLMERVHQLFEEENLYLDSKLSLEVLAKNIEVHPKILSQAINESTGQNFSFLINSYRIKHAQNLLGNPKLRNEKIIAIALDSGFRSLSTFNTVFKQYAKMTPSEYRKLQLVENFK